MSLRSESRGRSSCSSLPCGATRTATACSCLEARARRLDGRQLVIVGAERDAAYGAELHALAHELGIDQDVVFVGPVHLEETARFYQAADLLVYPSFNETFGLPILEAMACACPVVTSNATAMPETAGGAARLADPHDPDSIGRAILDAHGFRIGHTPIPWTRSRQAILLGCNRRRNSGCLSRGCPATAAAPTDMKVLITGGAGFIGSHTADRLLELGHEVVVLDALTPPVHRGGPPPT